MISWDILELNEMTMKMFIRSLNVFFQIQLERDKVFCWKST